MFPFIKRLTKSSTVYLLYLGKGLNSLSLVFKEDTPYKLVTRCGRQCNGRASVSRSKGREVQIPVERVLPFFIFPQERRDYWSRRDYIFLLSVIYESTSSQYEQFHEKTNIMDPALCIDQDQPAHSALANPGRHNPSQGDKGIE